VTATTTNLSLGSYSETVSVTSNGGNKSGTVSVKIIESSQTPIITKQPINKSVNIGKSATFVVTATCTNPIGYQWWRVPFVSVAQSKITNISGKIEGANTSQLKIINSRESDNNTQYLCEVWNILDHENLWVNSNSATLTIVQLPKLAISSGNIAHNFGSVEEGNNPSKRSYTFTIKNTGGGTLTGKVNNSSNWLSKSASTFSITQNKTKTITITATTTSLTSGSYSETVSVTSNGGNKSETVLVKIVKNSETPIITQQPNNMSVTKGESAIFSVNASCTNPIGYQWWRSPFVSAAQSKITNISGKIEGANTSQLKILNTTESDNNTNYVCEVWNTLDHENLWVNSNAATLSIVQLPKLEISSGNIAHNFGSVEEGKNPANRTYTFTIKNSGGGTLTGNVSENASWLSRSTSSFSLGTNQIKTITITATTSSLTSGSYSETISVTSNDVNKSGTASVNIAKLPKLEISLGSLTHSFGSVEEGNNLSNRTYTFTIKNSGGGTLTGSVNENASWLSRSTSSFSLIANKIKTITITATTTSLNSGSYSETISVTSNGGNKSGTASVEIIEDPKLDISVGSLTFNFGRIENGTNPNPNKFSFEIKNTGSGSLDGNLSVTGNWLQLSSNTFSILSDRSESFSVSATISNLSSGNYLETITISSNGGTEQGTISCDVVTGIEDLFSETGIPDEYYLSNNFPNPFNPSTKISFGLPEQAAVSLMVYDITGKVVEEFLRNEQLPAGSYSYYFEAKNLSSGIYIYKLQAGEFIETKKLILMK
ncbi:MAG: immunoglobulin domain-containing protein, partial [Melioribacteraceae bacterium]